MKRSLFLAILALTVHLKANGESLFCEASYGYQLQLTVEDHVLTSALIKLSNFVLLDSHVATPPENEGPNQNVNLWTFPIPSEKRILTLALAKDVVQDSEIPGTFKIEASTAIAEFPLSCRMTD